MLSKTPLNEDLKAAESWLMLEGSKEADEGPLIQDYGSAKLRVCLAPISFRPLSEVRNVLIVNQNFVATRKENRGKECFLGNAYQRRPMTLFERQPSAAEYDKNGVAKPIRSRKELKVCRANSYRRLGKLGGLRRQRLSTAETCWETDCLLNQRQKTNPYVGSKRKYAAGGQTNICPEVRSRMIS